VFPTLANIGIQPTTRAAYARARRGEQIGARWPPIVAGVAEDEEHGIGG
jgi:hypothetical protein